MFNTLALIKHREDCNRAFGKGCDARIAGIPKSANPYQLLNNGHGERGSLYWHFNNGWKHVHSFFGVDAKWQFTALPPVRGAQ